MKDRIKQLRKHLNLSQTEFGNQLGVSRDVVNNIEQGRVEPKPLFINHLCTTYNVDPVWLETGVGEMFIKLTRDIQIAQFIGETLADEDDTFKKRLISALSEMTIEEWEVLEKLITRLVQTQENKKESE